MEYRAQNFTIWVDADACPKAIKEIIYRAAQRVQCQAILVANKPLYTPKSKFITSVIVPAGFDVADSYIIDHMQKDDLVITADIPLAAEVISHNGIAINPRGELYDADTITERLSVRNFMEDLRSSGIQTGGPSGFSASNSRAFANQLDSILAKVNTTLK